MRETSFPLLSPFFPLLYWHFFLNSAKLPVAQIAKLQFPGTTGRRNPIITGDSPRLIVW